LLLAGVLAAIGAASLQYVDMNSPRNIFIFGLSMLSGLSLSFWMKDHPKAINTGIDYHSITGVLS
jgi:xanthine/uracil permease